jgi:hypothetical protein
MGARQEMLARLQIGPIVHGIIPEGHVRNRHIKELVAELYVLEAQGVHHGFRVQRLEHACRQHVELDGGPVATRCRLGWLKAKEAAAARSGLQDAGSWEGIEPQGQQPVRQSRDGIRAGEKCVQAGALERPPLGFLEERTGCVGRVPPRGGPAPDGR